MIPCRECNNQVSQENKYCPDCGCPHPSKDKWGGYGFEYKSPLKICGLPLLHISFKYRTMTRRGCYSAPVPAVGVIAIGQFAAGLVSISQCGIGLLSISQFTIAGFAIAQFAIAWEMIAQFGLSIQNFF